jgi:hypothetical protein
MALPVASPPARRWRCAFPAPPRARRRCRHARTSCSAGRPRPRSRAGPAGHLAQQLRRQGPPLGVDAEATCPKPCFSEPTLKARSRSASSILRRHGVEPRAAPFLAASAATSGAARSAGPSAARGSAPPPPRPWPPWRQIRRRLGLLALIRPAHPVQDVVDLGVAERLAGGHADGGVTGAGQVQRRLLQPRSLGGRRSIGSGRVPSGPGPRRSRQERQAGSPRRRSAGRACRGFRGPCRHRDVSKQVRAGGDLGGLPRIVLQREGDPISAALALEASSRKISRRKASVSG